MGLASVPFLGELLTPHFKTKYALASVPGAHQEVLRTLRNFVSIGAFWIEQMAALPAVMRTLH
jgi:hypothetical protein